jgi:hypothetical protein
MELAAVRPAVSAALALGWLRSARCTRLSNRCTSTSSSLSSSRFTSDSSVPISVSAACPTTIHPTVVSEPSLS